MSLTPNVAAEEKDKWNLVFYMPDNCPVRDRMVYASSIAALKLGLGAPKFVNDLTIREAVSRSVLL